MTTTYIVQKKIRRIREDLNEIFKIVNSIVQYGKNVFTIQNQIQLNSISKFAAHNYDLYNNHLNN